MADNEHDGAFENYGYILHHLKIDLVNMLKCCRLIFIVWLLPFLSTAQTLQNDPASRIARIQKTGVLRIGVPGDYAPFAMAKGDSLFGADITMARALAAALGAHAEFIKTTWPNLSADMKSDKFDIAIGGISVTPERAAIARF